MEIVSENRNGYKLTLKLQMFDFNTFIISGPNDETIEYEFNTQRELVQFLETSLEAAKHQITRETIGGG